MKRLLLALVLVIAAAAIFLGPPLRTAFAGTTSVEITLGRAPLHPTQQALGFMLDPPDEATLASTKKMKLWATYYHMPTVRAAWSSVAAKPLIDRNGNPVSPPLAIEDWCDAAMQGSVWVDNGKQKAAYMFVDSRGPEQVVCDKYFGDLSQRIKSATRRARFVQFHHPQACDVRVIPLMAFRTIAVDRDRIRMGTVLYAPKLRGKTFWNNGEFFTHDGYLIASDTGGAIEGNHIDMFVADASVDPFPDIVRSNPRHTFDAYPVAKDHPAAIALRDAADEICADSDGPGRRKRQPADSI